MLNYFIGCEIGNDGIRTIAPYIKQNHSITMVDLSDNQISYRGAAALSEILKHNYTLKSLDLGYNMLGEKGVIKIAESLKSNWSLIELNLSHNRITSLGLIEFAKALKYNSSLHVLNLSSNDIEDEGAIELAYALKLNKSLHTLNLDHNRICDVGALKIIEALRVNYFLTTLSCEGNASHEYMMSSKLYENIKSYTGQNKELVMTLAQQIAIEFNVRTTKEYISKVREKYDNVDKILFNECLMSLGLGQEKATNIIWVLDNYMTDQSISPFMLTSIADDSSVEVDIGGEH